MLYVDLKYISIIGPHLRNFKKKNTNLFNCSCPVCGDSKTKTTKARGYFFKQKNMMFFKCHNCQASMQLGTFLKTLFPSHYEEYVMERYKDGASGNNAHRQPDLEKFKVTLLPEKLSYNKMIPLSELPDQHYAKQYILNRKIPKETFTKIFFAEDFAEAVNDILPGKYDSLKPEDPRIVIPFLDQKKHLIGLQGRTLNAEKELRYITIKADQDVPLVYGLDRLNLNEPIYVVEGPIDSLFIPNCLAVAGADLKTIEQRVGGLSNVTFIFDNEPRNKQLVRLIEDVIEKTAKICIWPNNLQEKDINDMILSGKTTSDIMDIIAKNTFSGMRAKIEFNRWKRC